MEYRHGFETASNVAQIYETTIADTTSDLAAHIVTVPARSLGGSSYLFEGSDWPLEMLGLLRIADVPFGGVARSLAESLGNILTAQGRGEAGYMYHELTKTPLLAVAIPSGMVICGSAPGMIRALEAGLRQRLVELVKSRSGEHEL